MFHPVELLNECRTRINRPSRGPLDRAHFGSLWCVGGGNRFEWNDTHGEAETELMVVLTTYDRADGAARVLSRLADALGTRAVGARVLVLHDASAADYGSARAAFEPFRARGLWLDASSRLGKKGFWQVHQTALIVAQRWRPQHVLYLQDDVDFAPELLDRALALWRATAHDPLRRVLYLYSSRDDEANGRWVRFKRRIAEADGCRVTNWFDLQAFLVDRAFLELIDYRIIPVHPNRWRRKPEMSSGVGRQLTLRLSGRAHVYQAWPPLVHHGSQPSLMNPEARQQRSLDNQAEWSLADNPGVTD